MANKRYILCVDDEKSVLSSLKQELKASLGREYSFEIAESGEEALTIAYELMEEGNDLPVVISDQLMPGMKGDQFLSELHKSQPKTRKILLTGQASATAVGNALNNADLFRFLSKPWSPDDITMTVQQAINVYYLDQKLEEQNHRLQEINRFGQLVARHLAVNPWAETVLRELLGISKATKGVLAVYDPKAGDQPVFTARWDELEETPFQSTEANALAEWLPLGVVTKVRMSKKPVSISNVTKSEWAKSPYVKENPVKSLLCLPIQNKDQLLGVIYLEHAKKASFFNQDVQEFLGAVLGQAALALDNVLLYTSLEKRIEQGVEGIAEDHDNMRESIVYASRIQKRFLPTEAAMSNLFKEQLVYYAPKHVLSGDFYWAEEVKGIKLLCVADCTGHGVPGALMSILGLNLLNTLVLENGITKPNELLTALHAAIIQKDAASEQESNTVVEEGMDVTIAAIHPEHIELASAKRQSFFFHEGTCQVIKGDKHSVGDSNHRGNPQLEFALQTIPYATGDRLYLFSDGYQDQFGSNNKKFSLSRMKDLLNRSQNVSFEKQRDLLHNRHTIWRKNTPQTDDICLVGVQL